MTAPSPSPSPAVLPWTIRGRAANDGGHASWPEPAVLEPTGAFVDGCGEPALVATYSPLGFVSACDLGASTHAWLHAWLPDRSNYAGDLWSDVLEYREGRMRKLAGNRLEPAVDLRITELDAKLRARDTAKGRQFQRFECSQSARIMLPGGGALETLMVDVSAGGAKLEFSGPTGLAEGSMVSLCVESAGGPCDAMLPSRVVWSRAGAFGLMFAGAPRWG
jgi:PilZ domain-containing protein